MRPLLLRSIVDSNYALWNHTIMDSDNAHWNHTARQCRPGICRCCKRDAVPVWGRKRWFVTRNEHHLVDTIKADELLITTDLPSDKFDFRASSVQTDL